MSQPPEIPDSNAQPPDSNGRPVLHTLVEYDAATGKMTVTSTNCPPSWFVQLADGTRLPLDDYLANRHLYDSEFDASDLPDLGQPRNGDDGTT